MNISTRALCSLPGCTNCCDPLLTRCSGLGQMYKARRPIPGMLARFQFSISCERISAEFATSRKGCVYCSTPGIPNVLPCAQLFWLYVLPPIPIIRAIARTNHLSNKHAPHAPCMHIRCLAGSYSPMCKVELLMQHCHACICITTYNTCITPLLRPRK